MKTLFSLFAVLLLTGSAVAQTYDKLAPYAAIRWRETSPQVLVENEWFALKAIDGVEVEEMVEFCKETYDSKWRKRFEEDLVQVLTEMGSEPYDTVELLLVDLESGTVRVIAEAAMTKDNRKAIRDAAARARTEAPLSEAAWQSDLNHLQELVRDRWSYTTLKKVKIDGAFAKTRKQLGKGEVSPRAFAIAVQELLCRFGDGHAGVRGLAEFTAPGHLPFLISETDGRFVAFQADRSGFVEADKPYLISIDGAPVADWLKTAERLVASGSPQLVRRRALRELRYLGQLRELRGSEHSDEVVVELAGEDGKSVERKLAVAAQRPLYGIWPRRTEQRTPEDKIGYLRVARMDDGDDFLDSLDVSMAMLRDTEGLIIDVRSNAGGSRAALRRLLPYFMSGDRSQLINVAAYRKPPGVGEPPQDGYLRNRQLYVEDWDGWDAGEVGALEDAAAKFKPEWKLPKKSFTDWHYFVVSRTNNPGAYGYRNPVVVLMNSDCFSATDIFLGAFKEQKNVTLIGTPSAGGSGRLRTHVLPQSGIAVRLSSMASFQANGQLYDGNGIEPDVVMWPTATDFLEDGTDTLLDAAKKRLLK